MICIDFETSGLIANCAIPATRQPRIVEVCAIKLDDVTLEETAVFHYRLNPGILMEADAVKTHGITNEMVKDCPSFAAIYNDLADFFLGERTMTAHNAAFERDILRYELERIGKLLQFPWPVFHHCTVELTEHIKGYRLNLTDLHEHLFGEKFKGAHDAVADVRALARCYKACRERGIIKC
jgi:DNA polymerase III epsilon subunit-like protein